MATTYALRELIQEANGRKIVFAVEEPTSERGWEYLPELTTANAPDFINVVNVVEGAGWLGVLLPNEYKTKYRPRQEEPPEEVENIEIYEGVFGGWLARGRYRGEDVHTNTECKTRAEAYDLLQYKAHRGEG